MKFEYNLTLDELKKRTCSEYLLTKKFLDENSLEYKTLAEGDKEALKHLVKASQYIEDAYLMLDNKYNIEVKNFLLEEIKNGSEIANLTYILFCAQKGVNAVDNMSNTVSLIKGIDTKKGKGFYPEDLSTEEFHSIIEKMILNGDIEEVKNILNQRSVVVRNKDVLRAIDYTEYFKNEFTEVAKELSLALETSTDKDFNEYLTLQIDALLNNDPYLDALADKKWATLEFTPLEFTITRENYADEMTETIAENKKILKLLEDNNIKYYSKDMLGCRVGIINKEGTKFLTEFKKYLPKLSKDLPYSECFDNDIKIDDKQTMVDIDMVIATGDVGAYRGGITIAENLPNDDKLSLNIGGGHRNAYHRQIRFISDYKKLTNKLDNILVKEQHQYFECEADHLFTIGHENAHSLGPKHSSSNLGKYSSIIEENKADMMSVSFLDKLVELNVYTELQKKQIMLSAVLDTFLKSKPIFSQTHRVRSVMQNKYFYDFGAYIITNENKINVDFNKVLPAAKSMLEKIIKIQIDNDYNKAEEYVNTYFVWTKEMDIISKKLCDIDKVLNGKIENRLADMLMTD